MPIDIIKLHAKTLWIAVSNGRSLPQKESDPLATVAEYGCCSERNCVVCPPLASVNSAGVSSGVSGASNTASERLDGSDVKAGE